MIIGIDVDDTIAKSDEIIMPFATKYHKEVYKKENEVDLNYAFPKCFGWTQEEMDHFLYEVYQHEAINIEPKEDVKEMIDKLRSDGHKIVLITARNNLQFTYPLEATKEWLEKNDIVVDEVFVGESKKYEIVRRECVDIFIDDNFENCRLVKENNNIPVVLFATKTNNFSSDGIVRLNTWKEVYEYITTINNNQK